MNGAELDVLLKKMKPNELHLHSRLAALYGNKVRGKMLMPLALELEIPYQAFCKRMRALEVLGLVRQIDGGWMIKQLDKEPLIESEFKSPRDIINCWCELYLEHYGQPYRIGNWAVTQSNVKKLMRYTDEEIKGRFKVVMSLYEARWATKRYPKPTLGGVYSGIFERAIPYDVKYYRGTHRSKKLLYCYGYLKALDSNFVRMCDRGVYQFVIDTWEAKQMDPIFESSME